jgi:tetratricopeptide (TPR) repeat protein
LYLEYLKHRFQAAAVGGMLEAFREGLSTEAALQKVCQVSKEEFEGGYREYLKDAVRSLRSRPVERPFTFVQLQEAHEKDPNDPDISTRLAEQYLLRGRSRDARTLVDGVLAKKQGHPLGCYVKARLLLAGGDEEGAKALLEAGLNEENPEPRVVQALGRICFDRKDFAKAAKMFELGRRAEPYENRWLNELVRVYTQAGDKQKLITVLKDLVPADPDDLDARKQLARLLVDAEQHGEAERYARQALEIDVLDLEAQRSLGDALLGQKKLDGAIEAYAGILKIDDKADAARLQLARAYMENGRNELAKAEVEKVLKRDPANEGAKRLRQEMERSQRGPRDGG